MTAHAHRTIRRTIHRAALAFVLASLPFSLVACRSSPPPVTLSAHERTTAQTLQIGDLAPPLAISTCLTTPPPRDAPPAVRVVEFWASWCAPCLASMPLLADAKRQHGDALQAIALTTIDEDNAESSVTRLCTQHAAEWGLPLGVHVCIDDADRTARAYRVALRDTALPRAAVITRDGCIAWWGHPADAAPVIDAVINGSWDIAAARAQADARARDAARSRAVVERYLAATSVKDQPARLALATEACEIPIAHTRGISPEWWAWTTRVSLLTAAARTDEARAVALHAAELDGIRNDPAALGDLLTALPPAEVQLRRDLAERAVGLITQAEAAPIVTTWDAFLRDTDDLRFGYVFIQAADAFAAAGETDRAIALLNAAIDRAPDDTRFIGNKQQVRERIRLLESTRR